MTEEIEEEDYLYASSTGATAAEMSSDVEDRTTEEIQHDNNDSDDFQDPLPPPSKKQTATKTRAKPQKRKPTSVPIFFSLPTKKC